MAYEVCLGLRVALTVTVEANRQLSLQFRVLLPLFGVGSEVVSEGEPVPYGVFLWRTVDMMGALTHQTFAFDEGHVAGVPPVVPCLVVEAGDNVGFGGGDRGDLHQDIDHRLGWNAGDGGAAVVLDAACDPGAELVREPVGHQSELV